MTDRFTHRSEGHGYANDGTWEVASTLVNDGAIWSRIQALRDESGHVTGEKLKQAFGRASEMRKLLLEVPPSCVDWDQVATEFNPEVLAASDRVIDYAAAHGTGSSQDEIVDTATRRIDDDALTVLRRCTADARAIYLPPGQLDRKLYEKISKVLEVLGGKWNRSAKGHVFEQDASVVLEVARITGTYMDPKDFGFFRTQEEWLQQAVMDAADLEPGMLTLEPNGGWGDLAEPAAAIVGKENVITCELLPANVQRLKDKGFSVMAGDFLQMTPEPIFDRVIMNPPFDRLADVSHVTHAAKFLKPTGKLVAIMSPSFTFNSAKKAQAFRDLMEMAGEVVQEVDSGAFKSSGTMVRTVIVSMDAARLPWNQRQVDSEGGDLGDDEPPRERMSA